MAARHPPILFAWLAWVLMFSSWVLLLAGSSALQKSCGGSNIASSFGRGAGYLAPVSCDKLYRYAWWATWYQFAMVILVPALLVAGAVHKFRLGLVGLFIPIIMLLMNTTSSFFFLFNTVGGVGSSLNTRAKVLFAGGLIASVANFLMVMLVGLHDEDARYS